MRALTAAVVASAVLALLAGPSSALAGQCGATCSTVCRTGGCDYDSIAACALGPADGATCRVLGGTYHELVTYQASPQILRQNLVFQCADPASAPCVIDGDNERVSAVESYRNWTIEGFEIRNTTGDAVTSYAASYVTGSVRDCWIHDVGGVGIRNVGAGNVVERNRIERTGSHGILCGSVATSPTIVRNNLVVASSVASGGRGISCTLAGSEVLHNTVDLRDTSLPWAGAAPYGIYAATAKYNVVLGGSASTVYATVACGSNLAFAPGDGAIPFDGVCLTGPDAATNVTGDPLFLSAEDWRPGAGSPAIDLATTSTEATDLNGRARIVPDAGAFEWAEGDMAGPLHWPVREEVATPTTQAAPAMVLLPGRGPMVAWFAIRSLSDGDLVISERLPDGTWRSTVLAAGSVIPGSTSPNVFLQYVDLAVDPVTGRPAVAWVDRNASSQAQLRVARFLGEECATGDCTDPRWDGCGDPPLATILGAMGAAIAFPPDGGGPAVAAALAVTNGCGTNATRYDVLYARQDAAGAWQVQTVETAPCGSRVGYGIDVAFDPVTGAPGLAWARSTTAYGTIAFAEDTGAGFAVQEVALGTGTGTAYERSNRVSLAFGGDGTLGIAFTLYSSAAPARNGFGYVQRSLSGWESQAVLVDTGLGANSLSPYQGLDLAWSPDGAPWFVHTLGGVLRLADRDGEGWDYEGVDTRDVTGLWARMAFDLAGHTSLSWQQETGARVIRFLSESDPGGLVEPLPTSCDDGDLCTISACDPLRGCLHDPVDCGDGNACTVDECLRATGACSNVAVDCGDDDRCTVDGCVPETGECTHGPVSCDDGDRCTTDGCDGVAGCVNTPADCGDGDPCTTDGCDPATGLCTNLPADCDDADACTADGCQRGAGCTHDPVSCQDLDSCTLDGCDRGTGCWHSAVDCDDTDACTVDACAPATGCSHLPLDCDDDDNCTNDGCDTALGCFHDPVACDDGDACTTDSCSTVTGCRHVPASCDDGNACTVDSCDPATGCHHGRLGCDDGEPCTLDDCDAATGCTHAVDPCDDLVPCTDDGCTERVGCFHTPRDCDDADACTADFCEADTGACLHRPRDCGDGDACTTDVCDSRDGSCGHGTVDCDDGNACTTDSCDPATGCVHGRVGCDDGDPCTLDDCDPLGGCTHDPDPCSDGDACTVDLCTERGCVHSPVGCDDGDPCTTDGCHPDRGCWHDTWTGECDDGNSGTIRDTCVLGVCTGVPAVVVLPVITERVGVRDLPVLTPPAVISVSERVGVRDVPGVTPPAVISVVERVGVRDAPVVTPPAVIAVTERIGVAMTGTGSLVESPPEPPPETVEPVPDAVQPTDPGPEARDPGATDPGVEARDPGTESRADPGPAADPGTGGGGGGGLCAAGPGSPGGVAAGLLLGITLLALGARRRRPRLHLPG